MSSEVEKLYKLAEVKAKCIINGGCSHTIKCEECNCYLFSPFTAEKQLELIKLLCQRCDLTISRFSEWEFVHYDGQEPINLSGKDFVETLAKLVNMYWQDLTEEEKSEIKRFLGNE